MILQLLSNCISDALVKVTTLNTDVGESYAKAEAIDYNIKLLEKKMKKNKAAAITDTDKFKEV